MIRPAGFDHEVYDIVRQIPRGKVATYGQIARLAGFPNHARLVGRAMGSAPIADAIPCHRVVDAAGRTAPHWTAQRPLLEAEGVVLRSNGCVDLRHSSWHPQEWPATGDV